MKSNKWKLITALLYLTASICFAIASVLHEEISSKVLCCIAAVCFLAAGAGFFWTYYKKEKKDKPTK